MNKSQSVDLLRENNLSLFGRKVFRILLEQYNARKCVEENPFHRDNFHHRRVNYQHNKKKVLTFKHSEANTLVIPDGNTNDTIHSSEIDFHDTAIRSSSKNNSVPTSASLVKSVLDNNRDDTSLIVIDESQNKTDFNDVCPNEKDKAQVNFVNQNRITTDERENQVCRVNKDRFGIDTSRNVAWDDMFDLELFPHNDTNESVTGNKEITSDNNANGLSNGTSSNCDAEQREGRHSKEKTNIKTKEGKHTLKNGRKTKKQITNIINEKVKQINPSHDNSLLKSSFRKQKYTKMVQNWLNHADAVGFEGLDHQKHTAQGDDLHNDGTRSKISLEVACKDINLKKTVQAQLANKNGVMKFKKPSNETVKCNGADPSEKGHMENNKETKVRSKFVAPIKSQIPVQDITYKIVTANVGNMDEVNHYLELLADRDVFVILIYSNNYCQLNDHHTEDSCDPQGVLLTVDDTFYYIQENLLRFRENIIKLMNKNNVICYEGKALLLYFASKFGLGTYFGGVKLLDIKIGAGLLDPDNAPQNFTDLQKLLSFTPEFTIANECVLQKSAWYMSLMKQCWEKLQDSLMRNQLWILFTEIEMRVLPIIADMENRGICVNEEKLKLMEKLLLDKMKNTERECYKAAGKTFQINSTVQVRTILYDELKLDSKCNVKIRETISKGAKSTSESMLRSLISEHPLPKLILEYRHLHKALATFVAGIAQHVKAGVLRPIWEQNAAVTGRIASNSPNLQAIPKTFNLTLFPEAGDVSETVNLRSPYLPRPGHWLLGADFKHVECRVFAYAASDNGLLEALRSPDLFRVLSAKWLNKPEAEVLPEERERTKRVVYASLYGAGANKLADVIGLGYEHALSVAASFNRTFPSLKSFGRAVVSQCERDGKLRTLCNRMRQFKDIASCDLAAKSHAERQAVNFIVQGSAADLCKLAMVRTEQRLRSSEPPLECHLVLQIHDELVWEVCDEHLHCAAALIKNAMENCGHECGLSIVLPVALFRGRNWGEMEEFIPEMND